MKRINKKKIVICCFTILLMAILLNYIPVFADVGNNNRYDTSSSSSSSDDGGFFSLIIQIFIMLLFRYPLVTIILVVVAIILYRNLKKKGKLKDIGNKILDIQSKVNDFKDGTFAENYANQLTGEALTKKIKEVDPAFSEEAFIAWVREVFIKIQQAWSSRNWKIIRPFESNELFSQHSTQLQEYINNNKINMIEKIAVKSCGLRGFKQDGDKEVMTVELRAVMRDYVIDATTRQVLESDPSTDYDMTYIMTFARKAGVKTKVGTSNKSTTNCPNCGAPTEITSSGQCEYCGSVITTGEHDWVLTDIRKR